MLLLFKKIKKVILLSGFTLAKKQSFLKISNTCLDLTWDTWYLLPRWLSRWLHCHHVCGHPASRCVVAHHYNRKLPSCHHQFQFIKRENQFQCNVCNLKISHLLIGKSELDIPKNSIYVEKHLKKAQLVHILFLSEIFSQVPGICCKQVCKHALWLQWISVLLYSRIH